MMELLLYMPVSVVEFACHYVDWNLVFGSTTQAHAAYAYVVYDLYNATVRVERGRYRYEHNFVPFRVLCFPFFKAQSAVDILLVTALEQASNV